LREPAPLREVRRTVPADVVVPISFQSESTERLPVPQIVPDTSAPAVVEMPASQSPQRPVREVPWQDSAVTDRVQIVHHDDRISLTVKDAPLNVVLALLAEQHHLNIVASDEVNTPLSITLTDVSLDEALDAITLINGFTWSRQNNIILVCEIGGTRKQSPIVQGQAMQVFTLNYVLALDVDKVVKGLLSPVGQSFINQTSTTDQRKTAEQIVVQDLPAYIQRVGSYIAQVDQPPRQVVVEAHVLQVDLKGDFVHGVNLNQMFQLAKAPVSLGTIGLADVNATQTAMLKIDGSDLATLIQFLTSTKDAKTLATPKVAVLNGQEAKIQIGSKLGYKTLQTTQTATLQNVNFLDTGVILQVTPNITQDGQILLQVKPQVSDGVVDPTTGLPNSNTTEVATKVLLADGEAIVIGGLIKETDSEVVNKVPWLGDIKYLGWLFRHRSVNHQRVEIIITLLPRLVSPTPGTRCMDCNEVTQAHTPLLNRDLTHVERTGWEPKIPKGWPNRSLWNFEDCACAPTFTPGSESPATGMTERSLETVSRPRLQAR
jgi:type II secretory pathway component GspD/PulD (secretin)